MLLALLLMQLANLMTENRSETDDFPISISPAHEEHILEAILFAVTEPVTLAEFRERIPFEMDIKAAIERLTVAYSNRGVRIVRVGNGWAFRTAPEFAFLMHREKVSRRLSRAAMETLAIIAYHQPTTRAEIEQIRGVSVSKGTIDQLIELNWVSFGRRKQTPGRPMTFVTTRKFLDHFGLESTGDLPRIIEMREAGLLVNEPPQGS